MPESVVLTDEERQTVLLALWNYHLITRGLHAEDEALGPAELVAGMAILERINAIVEKLGGDPDLPGFGAGLPDAE